MWKELTNLLQEIRWRYSKQIDWSKYTSEELEEAAGTYDQWKDAYREAFYEYQQACVRKDWIEANRWYKRFVALFEPRRKSVHGSIWDKP